jgi:hypothetical protein
MGIRTGCVAVLLAASTLVPLSAQTGTVCEQTTCETRVGQSFIAFTEYDPTVWDYRLVVNGQVTALQPRIVNGFVEFTYPGFSGVGTHTLVITAQGAAGGLQYTDSLNVVSVRRKIKIR